MEVNPIPANEAQSVTLPVDFYADLVAKARTLELLENALVENVAKDYYRGKANVSDNFIYAIKAILPDTYEKMKEKLAEGNGEEE